MWTMIPYGITRQHMNIASIWRMSFHGMPRGSGLGHGFYFGSGFGMGELGRNDPPPDCRKGCGNIFGGWSGEEYGTCGTFGTVEGEFKCGR